MRHAHINLFLVCVLECMNYRESVAGDILRYSRRHSHQPDWMCKTRQASLLPLMTTKDQKILDADSAKATLAQELSTTLSRELNRCQDANILSTDTSFIQ